MLAPGLKFKCIVVDYWDQHIQNDNNKTKLIEKNVLRAAVQVVPQASLVSLLLEKKKWLTLAFSR